MPVPIRLKIWHINWKEKLWSKRKTSEFQETGEKRVMEEKGFKDVFFYFNGKTKVSEEEWDKWRYKYCSPALSAVSLSLV